MESKELIRISSTHDSESDPHNQLRKMFEWSDQQSGADDNERSHLLSDYKQSQAIASSKTYDTRQQPAFHENNKSFVENFCTCCIGANQNNELTRTEVSQLNIHSTFSAILLLQV